MTPEEIEQLPYRPCVGVMVVNKDGMVFAGRRCDTPDAWQMPQGGIDDGETPSDAALRELEEETSIARGRVALIAESADWIAYDLPHQLVPKIWKGRFRGQKQRWFLFRFTGHDDEIDLSTAHPEFNAWQWMEPDDLIRSIVPFKRATYTKVLAEFRALI